MYIGWQTTKKDGHIIIRQWGKIQYQTYIPQQHYQNKENRKRKVGREGGRGGGGGERNEIDTVGTSYHNEKM